ncbi:MAG: uroporphyrinogen decarboxylase family protein [Faecousia sp.]
MNERAQNYLKAVRFEHPDYIPMSFCINDACWNAYPQDRLFDLMESHPFLFPDFHRPAGHFTPRYAAVARKDHPFTDDFGCVWTTSTDGITGTVTGHPLADWYRFGSYRAPDPNKCMGIGPIDWAEVAEQFAVARKNGDLVGGGLRHGHTFLQLCDIRGYENLLFDMIDGEPRLWELIALVEHFNQEIVNRYIALGADLITYAEDLGMQVGPMLSPQMFRTYIKPSYQRLMKPARDKGLIIHMHSDGDIRELCDDLIDSGVQIINLQDLVNGIDWIADRFRGRTCVDLDIDRQQVTRFGTPREIDSLIKEEVEKIALPQGGLMMIYGLYPGVPLENVKALMDAMERYAFYFD